ncbi:MAG: murein L,D-transpeptidase family protein [Campylobacteraceae bacterium]
MKRLIIFSLLFGVFMNLFAQNKFLDEQLRYERVRTAKAEKDDEIQKTLKQNSLHVNNLNVLIVAFKDEDILELWAKNSEDTKYKLLKTYDVCAKSGELGPKYRQGDFQVPEGFYYIDRFNPLSSYYLSLGLNYPNAADKKRSNAKSLGGDIFIHGKCVTIGCLPMTDFYIKEIYMYAVYAKNSGQNKIPVYIFPFKMSDKNMKTYTKKYPKFTPFWENIKEGFDKFYTLNEELNYSHKTQGFYDIK